MFAVFAYGSNMFTRKMKDPAPSARAREIARLPGYRLRFNKVSDDGSGKGNIVATGNAGDETWGVIFEIADEHRAALDKSEGGYMSVPIDVLTEEGSRSVLTYIARPDRVDNSLRPYTWYKEFVVRGAEQHGLPPEYINKLKIVEAIADPDEARERKNRALLATAC